MSYTNSYLFAVDCPNLSKKFHKSFITFPPSWCIFMPHLTYFEAEKRINLLLSNKKIHTTVNWWCEWMLLLPGEMTGANCVMIPLYCWHGVYRRVPPHHSRRVSLWSPVPWAPVHRSYQQHPAQDSYLTQRHLHQICHSCSYKRKE